MLDGSNNEEVIREIERLIDIWTKGKDEKENDSVENQILHVLSTHPNIVINPEQQININDGHENQKISLLLLARREKWLKLEKHLDKKMSIPPEEERRKRGFRKKANIVQADPYEDEQTFMHFVQELSQQPLNVIAQKIKEGLFSQAVKKENIEVLKKMLEFKKNSIPAFDIFLRDTNNEHAFQHAIKAGNLRALEMLLNFCDKQNIKVPNVAHEIILRGPELLVSELLDDVNIKLLKRILDLPSTYPYSCVELAAAGRQALNGDGVVHDESAIRLADLRLKFAHGGKEPVQDEFKSNLEKYTKKKSEFVDKKEKNAAALFELSKIENESEIAKVVSGFEPQLCLAILENNQEGLCFLHESAISNNELKTKIAFKLFEKAYGTNPWSKMVVKLLNAKSQGKAPIYIAAESNNALFSQLFYKYQEHFFVNSGPSYCQSALIAAAKNGACEAVAEIIRLEPNCLKLELSQMTKDEDGKTLAHHLAQTDSTGKAFCAMLNNSGINTAQPFRNIMLIEDNEGNSVFDCLIQNPNAKAVLEEIVENMKSWRKGWGLEHIFDINQPRKNKNGMTDLEWVIKNGPAEIRNLLRKNIYDKTLFDAAFTKMNLDLEEDQKSSVNIGMQEVEVPQSRPTVCGVRVSTFGSRNQDATGIMHEVDSHLWGGNVGHATLTLTIPVNDKNKELIKTYCIDANIPYEKQKIITYKQTGKAAHDKQIAHEEEVYVINWSWWPGSDGGHHLVSALNLDGLSERRAVNREWNPRYRSLFTPETRTHGGMFGRTHMTYGTTGIVHGRGLSDDEKNIIELQSLVPILEQNRESCSVLIEKLTEILSITLSNQDIEDVSKALGLSREELCENFEINDVEKSINKRLYFKNLQRIIEELDNKDKTTAIDVLRAKLVKLIDLNKPIDLSHQRHSNTLNLIERFLPARKKELMADGKLIPFKALDELLLDAQTLENEKSKQLEEAKERLATLVEEKQEQEMLDKQQLEEDYNQKRQALEKLDEKCQQMKIEAEESQKNVPDLQDKLERTDLLISFFQALKKSQGWPKDLKSDENKTILDNIEAIEKIAPEMGVVLEKNSLTKAKYEAIVKHLKVIKQSLEEELRNVNSPKKQKKLEKLTQDFEKVRAEFDEISQRYHQVKSLIPSKVYEELVERRQAIDNVVGWCDELLENSEDPLEIPEDFKYWIVESKIMEDKLKKGFDYATDKLVLTKAEIEELKSNGKNLINSMSSQIVDAEPCQGVFAAGEFEQFLTMGTTPDHVVDIPLDNESGVQRFSPKGLNVEEMLKRMHFIVENSRDGFDLFNLNCSDTSLQILHSGASRVDNAWMRDIFTERAAGKLSTPQTVFNTAQSYNHAIYSSAEPTAIDRMNRNVDRWSPAVFVESVSLKALANPEVDPVSKAFALTLGLPVATLVKAPRKLLTLGYNMFAGSSTPGSTPSAPKAYAQAQGMPLEIENNIVYIHAYTAQQALKLWEQQLDEHAKDNRIPLLDKVTSSLFDNLPSELSAELSSKYRILQKRSHDKMRDLLSGKEPEEVAAPIQEEPSEKPAQEKKKSKHRKNK